MFSGNEKKIILGLLFSVLLASVFIQLASPQTYMVTESQLQKLEMEFQTLKTENTNLLKSKTNLEKISENYKTKLIESEKLSTNRQNTIEQLTESCSRLENNLYQNETEKQQLKEENSKKDVKIQKQKTLIVILFSVIGLFVIGLIATIIVKIKTKKL